jgi:transcriptional regulator with XRE-family HTH domain
MKHTETASSAPSRWLSCNQEVDSVSLGKKIKQLRMEKNWSQDEFAYHANIDGRQVSRYENDKVMPSVEVIIKIAKAFNVSTDFLLLDTAERRTLDNNMSRVAQRAMMMKTLSEDDEKSLIHLLDAIEAKNKFKAIASEID